MSYGLTLTFRDNLERDEQPRISSNPVTVLPNNTEPFMAEDLQVHTEGREDVGVEWRHLPCVEGYTVTFTSKDGREVTEEVGSCHLSSCCTDW